MVHRDAISKTLERWSPTCFLVAGGLFVLPAVDTVINTVTGTEIAVSLGAVYMFMLVVFVGLLGLYPRLAGRDATLARVGVGLLTVTAGIIGSILGVSVLPIDLTFGETTALAIVVTVAVGSTLTVTAFGVASLRTGAHSRPVGSFLLVMAVSMSVMIVAMLVYGHSTPSWVGVVVNGLVATSLGAIGFVLRTENVPTETADSTGDATAS